MLLSIMKISEVGKVDLQSKGPHSPMKQAVAQENQQIMSCIAWIFKTRASQLRRRVAAGLFEIDRIAIRVADKVD